MKKVTIITVNYNNRNGLERTIKSVIQQTYSDIEYIVIDGASTDGSIEVIKQYSNQISLWISEPDNGIYNAMNKGIGKANGNYILFLNSGDYLINSQTISNVFTKKQENTDLIIGRQKHINAIGKISKAPRLHVNEINMQFFLSSTLPHQATFIKRSLFDTCNVYNETYQVSADWVFWIKSVVEYGCTYKIIPQYISIMEPEGMSSQMNKCHQDMSRYLQCCLENKVLTWNDLFEVAMKGRAQDFCQRNAFIRLINKIIIGIGKHL